MSYLYGDSFDYLRQQSIHGATCTFIVENGVGLKLYDNQERCNLSFHQQLALHEMGLAPEVGTRFTREYPDTLVYGFDTEIVETYEGDDDRWGQGRLILLRRCHDLGVSWFDQSYKNIGFRRHIPLIIDCGESEMLNAA